MLRANQKHGKKLQIFPKRVVEYDDWDDDWERLIVDLPDNLKKFKFNEQLTSSNYVELQFWGEVRLKDVEKFYFKENPPSGNFLENLLTNKVKILDSRGVDYKDTVSWNP